MFSNIIEKANNTYWRTNGGNFLTSHKIPLTFVFAEFCPTKEIMHDFAVDETSSSIYDVIIMRDLLHTLGMDSLFSKWRIVWDDISIPIKTSSQVQKIIYHHLHGEDETIEYFEELHRMSVEDSINI